MFVNVWVCVLGLCVFLRVCVFSPAASIDYGSFADRCSTWLELLRLKAHTIRRGSVKTSRRTHSLAHAGDHTYKFTNSSWTCAHMHSHTPPCMPLRANHRQSSTGFFDWVWKLKPRPSESTTFLESTNARGLWWQNNLSIKNLVISCTITLKLTLHTDVFESGREILQLGLVGAKVFSRVWHRCQPCDMLTKHWSDVGIWAFMSDY